MAEERKPAGWRLPVSLRDRVGGWAKAHSLYTEDMVAKWLEERLIAEQKKENSKNPK